MTLTWTIAGDVKHAERKDDAAVCEANNWQAHRRGQVCNRKTHWVCARCGERVCGSHISQHQGERRRECQRWHKVPALKWSELLDRCSRIYFRGLSGPEHMDVIVNMEPERLVHSELRTGVIVPTRLHNPGFYLRWDLRYGQTEHEFLRTDAGLQMLRQLVEQGRVRAL